MDEMSAQVIEKICTLAPMGRYVILSADDFPDEIGENGLRKCLKTLKEDGYIDLKYSSDDLFCVAPIKAFVREEQKDEPEADAPEEISDGKAVRRKFSGFAFTFLAAFLGGAAGSLIISLIFALT